MIVPASGISEQPQIPTPSPASRQVTDAHLAALAAGKQSRLATFDRGLALLRFDAVELIN